MERLYQNLDSWLISIEDRKKILQREFNNAKSEADRQLVRVALMQLQLEYDRYHMWKLASAYLPKNEWEQFSRRYQDLYSRFESGQDVRHQFDVLQNQMESRLVATLPLEAQKLLRKIDERRASYPQQIEAINSRYDRMKRGEIEARKAEAERNRVRMTSEQERKLRFPPREQGRPMKIDLSDLVNQEWERRRQMQNEVIRQNASEAIQKNRTEARTLRDRLSRIDNQLLSLDKQLFDIQSRYNDRMPVQPVQERYGPFGLLRRNIDPNISPEEMKRRESWFRNFYMGTASETPDMLRDSEQASRIFNQMGQLVSQRERIAKELEKRGEKVPMPKLNYTSTRALLDQFWREVDNRERR